MKSVSSRFEPSKAFVVFHLVTSSVFWGCSFLFIKHIGNGLSPAVLASLRAAGGALTLAVIVVAMHKPVWPQGREWLDWTVLGTVNGWVPNILVAYALSHMDSGPGAILQASGPLMTAILAHALLAGERLTAVRFAGICVGLIGVAILIGPDAFAGGGTTLAIIAMLAVTFGYSLGNIYARKIPAADPLRLALGQQIASAIFATLAALAFAGSDGFSGVGEYMLPLVLLCVFSTALPIWLFMRLLTAAGPTKAAMTGYLVPAVAVCAGVVFLGEPVVMRQIIGGSIVLVGVAIVTGVLQLARTKTP